MIGFARYVVLKNLISLKFNNQINNNHDKIVERFKNRTKSA